MIALQQFYGKRIKTGSGAEVSIPALEAGGRGFESHLPDFTLTGEYSYDIFFRTGFTSHCRIHSIQ